MRIEHGTCLVVEEDGEIRIILVGGFNGSDYRVKILTSSGVVDWSPISEYELKLKKPQKIRFDEVKKIKKYFVKKLKNGLGGIIVPLDFLVRGKKLTPITSAQLKKIERKLFAQTLLFKIHEIENF